MKTLSKLADFLNENSRQSATAFSTLTKEGKVEALMEKFFPNEVLGELTFKTYQHGTEEGDFKLKEAPEHFQQFATNMRSVRGVIDMLETSLSFILTLTELRNKKGEVPLSQQKLQEMFSVSAERVYCAHCGQDLPYCLDFENNEVTISKKIAWANSRTGIATVIDCPNVTTSPQAVSLATPSKQLVVANDLRLLFPECDEYRDIELRSDLSRGSVNSRRGREKNTEYWASQGLIYFQVGNSSPTLYVDDEQLMLARDFSSEFHSSLSAIIPDNNA